MNVVFFGSWICSVVWWPFGYHHPFCSLSLSLWCIYFEGVPAAEVVALREWFDSLLIWWSESGGSSESEYQWWFAFWFGFDWNKVFLFGILWTGCFILEQKLKIFRKSPLCIHSSVWMKEKEKREREKMIVIFNLNDVPLLPLLFEMMSVVCVNPFPSLLVCKIEDCVPLCIAIQEVTRFSSVPHPFFCSALCESCFLLNLLFTSAMSPQWSWDFKLY